MAREIVAALSAEATHTTSRLQQSNAFSTDSNSTEMVGARITAGSEDGTISIQPRESYTASIAGRAFTSFKKLPPELRVMIWERAARTKRTITITHYNRGPYAHDPLALLHNATTIPTILRICKESRDVGLKLYKLSLSGILCSKPIYINYDQDSFFFPNSADFEAIYELGETRIGVSEQRRLKVCEELSDFERDLQIMMLGSFVNDYVVTGINTPPLGPLLAKFWRLKEFHFPHIMCKLIYWDYGLNIIKNEWKKQSMAEKGTERIPRVKLASAERLLSLSRTGGEW